MKNGISVSIFAMLISVLIVLGMDASANAPARPELTISFKELRAYDPATNDFTGASYLVKTENGPGCIAVFAAADVAVDKIEALAQVDDARTWSGSRADFATTGLPNPCP